MSNNIIITGGPGSGKSTLLTALEQNGHHCIPEVSRQLIRQQVVLSSHCVPWNDLNCFAGLSLDKMIQDFISADQTDKISFFDRGIPDIIAYLKVGGLQVGRQFYDAAQNYKYESFVFITPPWKEIYVNDTERWQTFDEACILYEMLVSVYSDLGYEIIELPHVPIEERLDFVLKTLPSVKSY